MDLDSYGAFTPAGAISPQGGVDAARRLLRKHYDPVRRIWDLPREGDLWGAVRLAHSLGRSGNGRTLAVIDDGFDLSIPALAELTLAWPVVDEDRIWHGSVVALLILAVAPDVDLRLYPVAQHGRWSAELIVSAVADAARRGLQVLNLSFGQPLEGDVLDRTRPGILDEAWPDMTGDEIVFYTLMRQARSEGWRELLRPVRTPIGAATAAAAARGCVVVAAAGNDDSEVFSPSVEATSHAVGFASELRHVGQDGTELAWSLSPTGYEQSTWLDFVVRQPAGALGSSFATPLVTGLTSLMAEPHDLTAYRSMKRLAGLGADAYRQLAPDWWPWSNRRHGVTDEIFSQAVNAGPHPHYLPEQHYACPECSFFAVDAYVNAGLFNLRVHNLRAAEQLLLAAHVFAPNNDAAAANLGFLNAVRAMEARDNKDAREVVRQLDLARNRYEHAVRLRPDHLPYRARLEEFTRGLQSPDEWVLAP